MAAVSGTEAAGRSAIEYLSYSLVPSRFANSVQVMKMCEAFQSNGHDVTLHCRRGPPSGDLADYYGVRSDFSIRGLRIPRVPILTRAFYTAVTAWRVARGRGPRLLYGRDYYLLGLLASLDRIDAPVVLEVHQPPSSGFERFLQRRIFRHPRFARLVVISQALRRHYLETFGDSLGPRVLVAPDGAVDEGAGPPAGPTRERVSAGYVGSLNPGKGVEQIVELAACVPEVDFHVVGGTEDQIAGWKERAPHANLKFHGFMPPGAARDAVHGFDIALAPYQPSVLVGDKRVDVAAWMSPLKVFEAMAAGRAILASDLPVLREVLEDGRNARLVPPGDTAAWAEAIRMLAAQPTVRIELGARAREDFLASFTWNRRAELVLADLGGV